ncbi:MAG: serine/threonine-protein kinase, partial [Anaerolineae bacterium]
NRSGARFCNRCGAVLSAGSTQPLQSGQTMNNGQYRIVRRLDTGGMGTIYLAANTQAFDRLCVIKEMLTYYQPDEEAKARDRFEEEAKTLASLRHPGVPDMYGFFSEAGHHYIVMEYIEGDNLAAGLTRMDDTGRAVAGQARTQEDVVRYGIQICRVLEYLAGIQPTPVVHNDIKPANIIIDKHGGQAVLVDFGTASARYDTAVGGQPGAQKSSVYGTVGYAAPELYDGRSEPRSDVYALAATTYHLLTDDDPRDHPFKFPKLNQLPASLRVILQNALATNLHDRLTATEFRQQLEAFRAAHAGSVQPLRFPQGDQATTLTGLLDLSMRYWPYARQILYDGSLENWLRTTLHDPVTANMARDIAQQLPDNHDAGLDRFLRTLNPRLGAPRIRVLDQHLDFGSVPAGASTKQTLAVVNTGYGGAHGLVKTSAAWLQPESTHFGCGPAGRCDIPIRVVDTSVLAAGRHKGKVMLVPSGGSPITIKATVRIRRSQAARPSPSRPVSPPRTVPRRRPRRRPWFVNIWILIFLIWLLSNMFGSCVAGSRRIDMPGTMNGGRELNPPAVVVQPTPQPDFWGQVLDQVPEEYKSVDGIARGVGRVVAGVLEEMEGDEGSGTQ